MLHVLSSKMIILMLTLTIVCLRNANINATPQCSENQLSKEEIICTNVKNTAELEALIQNSWRQLKIVNDISAEFIWESATSQKFHNLEHLDLSHAGELTVNNNAFKDLPKLKSLNVTACDMESLEAAYFSPTNELTNLDASWNLLQNLNADVQNRLMAIEVLNLSHNAIHKIESDALMPNLRILHLDFNEIQTIKLRNYKNLEMLTLSDNQLEKLPSNSFDALKSLEELTITKNPLRDIEDLTFKSLTALKTLNLSANSLEQLSAEVFAGLQRLLQLDLNSNNLKELTHLVFNPLVKLQYLDISRNSIKALNSSHFNGLTSLRKLFIYENDVKEITANTFAHMTALDTLDLSYNSLEFIDMEVFGPNTLPRLRKLMLKTNNLKSLHPLAFSSLPFLEYLSLGNNELTSLDVRMFAPLRRLEKLHLGNNLLEMISADVFEAFDDVSELLLDNNRLSFLPNSKITFRNLRKVSLEGNPWECPCWDQITRWLEGRRISYVRPDSPYFKGQKPLCVVIPVDFCVRDIKLVREHKIYEIFQRA